MLEPPVLQVGAAFDCGQSFQVGMEGLRCWYHGLVCCAVLCCAVLCCAAGVMLFCLGRDECPVDTHVWEISKQVGGRANVAGAGLREAVALPGVVAAAGTVAQDMFSCGCRSVRLSELSLLMQMLSSFDECLTRVWLFLLLV
jgi:hypothetical protein